MPDHGLLTPGGDVAPGSPAAVTDDVAVVRAMLAVEAAWVRAQVRCGVVPAVVSSVVDRAVVALAADDGAASALARDVARDAAASGNPVIPLLARLRPAVESAAGVAVRDPAAGVGVVVGAVHAGLTSQDVLDTALVLMLRDTGRAVDGALAAACSSLGALAREFRETPALARTLTQAAVPTTLGARFAGWLQGVAEARAALAAAVGGLPLAWGGAAGTLAATRSLLTDLRPDALGADEGMVGGLGDGGLVEAWAAELSLPVGAGPWHVTRFPVVRAAAALAEVCAALGTAAADVLVGARPEVGELREPAAPGRGASSTMAHKRNPVLSVLVRRSSLAAPALLAQVVTAAGLAVDERPDGAWHAEWPALQQLARHAVAAAHTAAEALAGLEVDTAAVERNLREHLNASAGSAGTDDGYDTGAATAVVDRVLGRYDVERPGVSA